MFSHDFERFPELTNEQLEIMQFYSPHVQIVSDFEARVVKVHDGDTVTLNTAFRDFDFPLRLADIDAPELSEGGEYAKEWLEGAVLGEVVNVEIDFNNRVGKYGRLIGRIFSCGLDVGDSLLRMGLVSPFGKKNEGAVEPIGLTLREVQI